MRSPAANSLRRSLFGDSLSLYNLLSKFLAVAQLLGLHDLCHASILRKGLVTPRATSKFVRKVCIKNACVFAEKKRPKRICSQSRNTVKYSINIYMDKNFRITTLVSKKVYIRTKTTQKRVLCAATFIHFSTEIFVYSVILMILHCKCCLPNIWLCQQSTYQNVSCTFLWIKYYKMFLLRNLRTKPNVWTTLYTP